jgi:hypothetical protein
MGRADAWKPPNQIAAFLIIPLIFFEKMFLIVNFIWLLIVNLYIAPRV